MIVTDRATVVGSGGGIVDGRVDIKGNGLPESNAGEADGTSKARYTAADEARFSNGRSAVNMAFCSWRGK